MLHPAGSPEFCARRHFFSSEGQFSTTVKGVCADCAVGAGKRKRLPSALTSHWRFDAVEIICVWKRTLGTPIGILDSC